MCYTFVKVRTVMGPPFVSLRNELLYSKSPYYTKFHYFIKSCFAPIPRSLFLRKDPVICKITLYFFAKLHKSIKTRKKLNGKLFFSAWVWYINGIFHFSQTRVYVSSFLLSKMIVTLFSKNLNAFWTAFSPSSKLPTEHMVAQIKAPHLAMAIWTRSC